MLDTYTKARDKEAADFAALDFDVLRIVPPMAFIPIPGEECVSTDGISMVVDRVTEFDCGIVVAGRRVRKAQGMQAGTGHCFIFRFVPFPPAQ